MNPAGLARELEALESAEEFLDHFGVRYDAAHLQRCRLHVLQRFHDYLRAAPGEPDFATCAGLLARAYQDFVVSDPQREGVFRVFKRARGIQHVPLSAIVRRRP